MSTAEQGYLFENLRKVISLVDQLRDIGMSEYISLPRIAVLGSQSAGKSSLLEQIVGLDFLPRGSGVVTRRPLELRLVYKPKEELPKPYGIFDEIPNKQFFDFQEVKSNIDVLTDKIAGTNKNIVDKPIVLKIFSSTCPDLTLIDLPGITRIPMGGTDQKQDIEKVTKDMAARYCSDPNTIILCVIPANDDISNSDGLQMAKRLDPQGERTFGVLTKLDIMDEGTNAKDNLLGKNIPLKLGYVGVINRTNLDIKNKKPVLQHLEDEKKYFAKHPVYSTLANQTGTSNLTKNVTEIFYSHIRKCLPVLEKKINEILISKETRLNQLGTPLPETDKERTQYLWQVVTEFSNSFKTSIAGTYNKSSKRNGLPVGCLVRDILKDLYSEESSKKVCNIYTDKDILKAMQFHEGDSIPGFPSIDAFLSLLIPQLKKLKDPAFDTLQETYSILEDLAIQILDQVLVKVPALKEELQEQIINSMIQEREKTREIIDNVIETEINYIFTNDLNYMNEATTTKQIQPVVNSSNPNQQYQQNQNQNQNQKQIQGQQQQHISGNPMVNELRKRIDMYFKVVMRGVRDTIPKMIGTFLVKSVQDKLKTTLFETVNRSKHFFKFMEEPKHLVEERQELRKGISIMKKAKQAIKRDPDLSTLFNNQKTIQNGNLVNSKVQEQKKQNQSPKKKEQADDWLNETNKVNKNPKQQQQFNQPPQQQFNQPPQQKFNQPPQQQAKPAQQQPPQQSKAQQDSLASLFGTTAIPNNTSQKNSTNSTANTSFNNTQQQPKQNIQNQQQNKPPQQQQQQQQQQNQPPKQGFVDNSIDKGVDKMFASKKFQDNLTNAASKGMYAAVDSQVPIKGKDGKNPVADFMGQQAGKAVQNEKVQNEMKNQTKAQAKDQVQQQKKKTFW